MDTNPRLGPSTSKHGFKPPRQPWSLIKVLPLDEYDKEAAYAEIKTILTQSLDDAGSKIFIQPQPNSIAGRRPKQVSSSFFAICFLIDTNCFVLFCRTINHEQTNRPSILFFVHSVSNATAVLNVGFSLLKL